jgi:hypothetical protein
MLDMKFAYDRTETEYVSQMLTLIKRFAQHHACHVWLVAHPRQVGICNLRFLPVFLRTSVTNMCSV